MDNKNLQKETAMKAPENKECGRPEIIGQNPDQVIISNGISQHATNASPPVHKNEDFNLMQRFLVFLCLNPNRPLQKQLIASFGSIATITVLCSLVLAIIFALKGGQVIKDNSRQLLYHQVSQSTQTSSRYQAALITERISKLRSCVSLMVEITRDAIVGYPDIVLNDEIVNKDMYVPFATLNSSSSYPFRVKDDLLKPDWQTTLNLNNNNVRQHVHPEREEFFGAYKEYYGTEFGTIALQGNCDPNATDPDGSTYLPNCTEANNDFYNGGAVFNNNEDIVKSTRYLTQKANEIALFIKPLFEAEPDAYFVSIGFKNFGAGLTMTFPSGFTSSRSTYTSIGCDWLRTINPYTKKPMGTQEEIDHCHSDGTEVGGRFYNPMERIWCREQAFHPGETSIHGPYLDADGLLLWLSIGQPIFDRRTGEFIGCTSIDLPTNVLQEFLNASIVGDFTSTTLVRSDGIVISGEQFAVNIWETGQINKETFQLLTNIDDHWGNDGFSNTVTFNQNVLSAYPIPTPPTEYDPNYRPDFFIIIITDGDIFDVIEEIKDQIDMDVSKLIAKAALIAGIGLVFVLGVIWSVARTLTLPLTWMNTISSRIVNHTAKDAAAELHAIQGTYIGDDDRSVGSDCNKRLQGIPNYYSSRQLNSLLDNNSSRSPHNPLLRPLSLETLIPEPAGAGQTCPKTEISALVKEFKAMIVGFSGTGPSMVARTTNIHDISNPVLWQVEFQDLYNQRSKREGHSFFKPVPFFSSEKHLERIMEPEIENQDYKNPQGDVMKSEHQVKEIQLCSKTDKVPSKKLPMDGNLSTKNNHPLVNFGPNLRDIMHESSCPSHIQSSISKGTQALSAKLFWWIVGLIMVPLLITNILTCVLVSVDLLKTFPAWVDSAESRSLQIELDSLVTGATLRALFAEQYFNELLRDVYLLTRVSQFVLLDVVNRKETVPSIEISSIEECKFYNPSERTCPYFADEKRSLCDCEWEDLIGQTCNFYDYDTRYFQDTWFTGQSTDIDPTTGDRIARTIYPNHSTSASTTEWFDDISKLPGYENGPVSSGYKTSYDRVRAMGALSTIAIPLYNYAKAANNLSERSRLGFYFASESDGSFWGYSGCTYPETSFSHFQSNDGNRAYTINPELCPKGKFGFDARCREWYDTAKRRWIENQDPVHLTLPYVFASLPITGMSAVSIVTDPQTNELIGETLIDFTPDRILDALLDDKDVLFSFLISPVDELAGDTVIGPGQAAGDPPKPVSEVILPNDLKGSENRDAFRGIVARMKLGDSGLDEFKRKKADGSGEDTTRIAYAPVYARVLAAIEPEKYESGSIVTRKLVYSVGIVESLDTLQSPFLEIEEDIDDSLGRLTYIYISLVIFVILLCVVLTSQVSILATIPMILLLRVVQNVNDGNLDEELPNFHGGSAEANHVYSSFAKLYKIIRVANVEFFSGNLKWAYNAIYDAMQLFRKINDSKAIGIACNNLGCTLFAISRNNQDSQGCRLVNGVCSVKSAVKYLNESVVLGKKLFEDCTTGDDELKAKYALQLADRHFNRALCILSSLDDPCCPVRVIRTGHTDLQKSKSLDQGAKDILTERNLLLQHSDIYFERLLRRMHGLAAIIHIDPNVSLFYDPKDLVDEANSFLQANWECRTLPIFANITRVGRLQQLECAVMNLYLSMGDNAAASAIGIRMIAEDEYINDNSYTIVSEVLLQYMESKECNWSQETTFNLQCDLLHGMKFCRGDSSEKKCKSLIFAIEVSDKISDQLFRKNINEGCLALFDDGCRDEDFVGLIAFGNDLDGGMIQEFDRKKSCDAKLRSYINSATKGTCSLSKNNYRTIPLAAQMVVNASTRSSRIAKDNNMYLVFITDGTLWDSQSSKLMLNNIERMHKASPNLHIIVIGIEIENTAVATTLDNICQSLPHSVYIDAARHTIRDVLSHVSLSISAERFFGQTSIQHGLTIEKF